MAEKVEIKLLMKSTFTRLHNRQNGTTFQVDKKKKASKETGSEPQASTGSGERDENAVSASFTVGANGEKKITPMMEDQAVVGRINALIEDPDRSSVRMAELRMEIKGQQDEIDA